MVTTLSPLRMDSTSMGQSVASRSVAAKPDTRTRAQTCSSVAEGSCSSGPTIWPGARPPTPGAPREPPHRGVRAHGQAHRPATATATACTCSSSPIPAAAASPGCSASRSTAPGATSASAAPSWSPSPRRATFGRRSRRAGHRHAPPRVEARWRLRGAVAKHLRAPRRCGRSWWLGSQGAERPLPCGRGPQPLRCSSSLDGSYGAGCCSRS